MQVQGLDVNLFYPLTHLVHGSESVHSILN